MGLWKTQTLIEYEPQRMIQQDTKTVIKGFLDGGEQITLFLQQCIKSQPIRQKKHPERGLWLAIVD